MVPNFMSVTKTSALQLECTRDTSFFERINFFTYDVVINENRKAIVMVIVYNNIWLLLIFVSIEMRWCKLMLMILKLSYGLFY